jgi:hypothetical protein
MTEVSREIHLSTSTGHLILYLGFNLFDLIFSNNSVISSIIPFQVSLSFIFSNSFKKSSYLFNSYVFHFISFSSSKSHNILSTLDSNSNSSLVFGTCSSCCFLIISPIAFSKVSLSFSDTLSFII